MKRIGILGGSFNPVHNAHVKLGKMALYQALLDEILYIPTYMTNLKDNSYMASPYDRLNMCRLAVSGISEFYVSDLEIKRKRITYTSETIEQLRKTGENEYFLIMGADSYINLYKWHNYEYILNNAHMIVAPRDDTNRDDLIKRSHDYEGYDPIILNDTVMELSSTMIRDMISKGSDVSMYLDKKVIEYINEHNLYKTAVR